MLAQKSQKGQLQAWICCLLGLHPQTLHQHHTAPKDHRQGLTRWLPQLLLWVSITAFTNSPLLSTKSARLLWSIAMQANLMRQLTLFSWGMMDSVSVEKLISSSFLVTWLYVLIYISWMINFILPGWKIWFPCLQRTLMSSRLRCMYCLVYILWLLSHYYRLCSITNGLSDMTTCL